MPAGRPLAEPVRGAAVPARLVHTHISTRALNISPCFRPAAVALAFGSQLALCELTGLRSRFTLEFIQHELPMHQLGGIPVFTPLFSLGNLIRIPGWLFLAAAVLTLGKISGETATYIAATISCCITFSTPSACSVRTPCACWITASQSG